MSGESSLETIDIVQPEAPTSIVLQQPDESRLINGYINDSYSDSEDSDDGCGEVVLPDNRGDISATVQNSTGVIIAHTVNNFHGTTTLNYPLPNDGNSPHGITYLGEIVNNNNAPNGNVTTNGNVQKPETTNVPPDKNFAKKHKKCLIILITVSIIAICITSTILVIFVNRSQNSLDVSTYSTPSTGSTPSISTTTQDPDPIVEISKSQWGGRDPLNVSQIASGSVPLVVVKHTGGTYCNDFKECASTLQALQAYQVGTLHSPDIWYNFLIGGDGNIYVGRGWNVQNEGRKDTVDITYIGNFTKDVPTEKMIEAGKRVVINGIISGYIFYNYNVVNHNQTENTTSPGENIFREVVLWPNYYKNDISPNCKINGKNIEC